MSTKNGRVIAFDGPDGVGKSTQLELTAKWLESRGFTVWKTKSSGGTPIGEELSRAMKSDHPRPAETDLYISLAMARALADELKDHIAKGEICLIDRSPLASLAYNTYASQLPEREQGIAAAEQIFKWWGLDALVYFEADQGIIEERLAGRTDKPKDYFENQDASYHQRVREGYKAGLDLLRQRPELVGQTVVIDASPGVDGVQQSVEAALSKLLS